MNKIVFFLFACLSSCVQNENQEITKSINETFKAIDENINIADTSDFTNYKKVDFEEDYSFEPSENNITPMSDELSKAYDSDKK